MTAAPKFVCSMRLTPTARAWASVAATARREARSCAGSGLDEDDLASIGALALLDTLARADMSRAGTLDAYLAGRIQGAMRDAVRAGRRKSSARVGQDGAFALLSAYAGDVAAGPHTDARVEDLVALIARLPAHEARVLRELDLEDRPILEVARSANVSVPTLRRIRKDALSRIRTAVSDDYARGSSFDRIEACLGAGEIQSATPRRPRTKRRTDTRRRSAKVIASTGSSS